MMKFILYLFFMIPLCFYSFYFSFNQFFLFLLFLLFFIYFNLGYYFCMLSYMFGCDMLSFFLILLSIWICSLMLMASNELLYSYYSSFFNFIVIILLFSLFLTFCSMNFFVFYIFFELSLILTLILILGWGYQPERIQAGFYIFMYTMFGSLPMIMSLLYIYMYSFSLYFFFMDYISSLLIYLCTMVVFLVKIPMFMFHLWLPKAHVEAPVSGSMILAGIMLKLGGYGLIRMMKVFLFVALKLNYFFIIISLFGGFVISLICLRQIDMKSLVAYSSVSHMGLVLSGLMTINMLGFNGALMLMIAHGLCSSGLFCIVNISYERMGSRSLFLNKGMINYMPSMSMFWFLLCSSNMGAPFSMNLFGEILIINSLISWSNFTFIFIIFIMFLSSAYSLFLYSYSQCGKIILGSYSCYSGNIREYLLLLLHWLPLNLIFLVSDLFI
uniref:NADH-ubiquinone oxidoreductase chain 4 n=1 Tax=Stenocladius sp. FM17 TaxID=2596692 RepID=A0A5C0PXD1_9COLE|nr:NADH dehydrogenase subunit 4 [Stenocladius sp. FM17]